MKPHHEFLHAYDTIKHFNHVVSAIDGVLANLKNEDIDGYPLEFSLAEIKAGISSECQNTINRYSNIDKFLKGHEVYDLLKWTNKTRVKILTDKPIADKIAKDLPVSVNAGSVNRLERLAAIASNFTNNLEYATPLKLSTEMHYAIILNDWLDASSYICKGINPNDGSVSTKTDEQKRAYVKGCLKQFGNLTWYRFSNELRTEVNAMQAVRDEVMAIVDKALLSDIASLIDGNIPKLPLMRRVWAIQ